MADEVDTSTEALDASIDASAEQQLEMYAQFGSQAEAVMNQLHTQAVEAKQDYAEAEFMPDASVQADAFAELESDYDMLVGGIQREMMLNQQATLSSIQHQQNATQNYMDMISAALPALEARMSAQVAAAGRAGSGGGLGTSPYDFGDSDGEGDGTTTQVEAEAGDYDEQWAQELSQEDKMNLAREIGMDPHDLWGDPTSNFFATVIDDPDRQKWFHEDLAEQFGVNIESLEETYNRVWGAQTEIDAETGEWTKKPHWFHQDGLSLMHSLIANGMDPVQARDYAYEQVVAKMEEQYADDEIKHDPEKYQGWINDFEFIMDYTLQGTLHNRNEEFNTNYLFDDEKAWALSWEDAGVTTLKSEYYKEFAKWREENDKELTDEDEFSEIYWADREEDKEIWDNLPMSGDQRKAQKLRDQTTQDIRRMGKLDPDREPFIKPPLTGPSPDRTTDVWQAIADMETWNQQQKIIDQDSARLSSQFAGEKEANLDAISQAAAGVEGSGYIPPFNLDSLKGLTSDDFWAGGAVNTPQSESQEVAGGIDFSSPEMQQAIEASMATQKLGGSPQATGPTGQETLQNFIEQKKRETQLLQFRNTMQPAPTPPAPTPPAPTAPTTQVVPPHIQRMMDQERRRKEAEAAKVSGYLFG